MYSFYRAWLMRDAFSTSIGNPPDVILQVGPTGTQFAAHRAVLASHSGYFKSVFAHPTNPVIVSNVGVSEFTSLLTWMYTGFIDLNLENIYNILLATHLLHMPSALEICRNFLVQNNHLIHENRLAVAEHPPPPFVSGGGGGGHGIIKPIPSRKFLPDVFRFEPMLRCQQPQNLPHDTENTSFQKVEQSTSLNLTTRPSRESPAGAAAAVDDDDDDNNVIEIEKSSSPKPSTSFRKNPSPIGSLSPNLSDSSEAVVQYERAPKKGDAKRAKRAAAAPDAAKRDQVVVDVACCDGPVRFHRVLNDCYGLAGDVGESVETETKNRTEIMNKVMSESINHDENLRRSLNAERKAPKGDECSRSSTNSGTERSENGAAGDAAYTCVYCNHTFKSQYCYQKHARRHINPVTLNSTCKADGAGAAGGGGGKGAETRREVKLLDMNVQYYPCKTCGSKFPSYYFVHKHRKMYHAEEMIAEKEICVAAHADGDGSAAASGDGARIAVSDGGGV